MEIKEAIEFLKKYTADEVYTHKCITSHNMAISALEKRISMKPVFVHPLQFDNWIPCKERLPGTFEQKVKAYLTTNEEGMIGVSYYHPMCGWSNGYKSVFDVIAWQPLPEPYREEQ